jgi:hypothetical protein
MTAATEEMGKFMEMLTKAMLAMADKEKDDKANKAERKIFDKEFMKEARYSRATRLSTTNGLISGTIKWNRQARNSWRSSIRQ